MGTIFLPSPVECPREGMGRRHLLQCASLSAAFMQSLPKDNKSWRQVQWLNQKKLFQLLLTCPIFVRTDEIWPCVWRTPPREKHKWATQSSVQEWKEGVGRGDRGRGGLLPSRRYERLLQWNCTTNEPVGRRSHAFLPPGQPLTPFALVR